MLLEPMLSRLSGAKTLDDKIEVGLQDIVSLHGAEMGNVQLLGRDGSLVIVAERGLGLPFLKLFERVAVDSGTVCGRAARAGKPIFVADVRVDVDFEPYVDFANSVPFRSVLSLPLTSSAGEFVGMVSAHSAQIFKPTALELKSGEVYARHLADEVVRLIPGSERIAYAERCSAMLLKDKVTGRATRERLRAA